MPEPVRGGHGYLPGSRRLRRWRYYLITDLLLGQWEPDERLHLGDFWLRRAQAADRAVRVSGRGDHLVTLMDQSQFGGLRGAVAAGRRLREQPAKQELWFRPPAPFDH